MNSHIKRPRMTVNWEIWSRNMANLQSQIREFADKKTAFNEVCLYRARRLIGTRIIITVAYCNQILQAQLYINSAQNMSVNCIIWLLLPLLCQHKVILLNGGHCITSSVVIIFKEVRKISNNRQCVSHWIVLNVFFSFK